MEQSFIGTMWIVLPKNDTLNRLKENVGEACLSVVVVVNVVVKAMMVMVVGGGGDDGDGGDGSGLVDC